jgi:peptidase E
MESKKLFLASFFKDVAQLFPEFAGQDIQGKRVTFIPTASIHEKLRFYVGADRKALKKIGLIVDELEVSIEYIKAMDNCFAAPDLKAFTALNIVDFYPVPHHTNFPFKKTVEKIITKYGAELKLYPISNKQTIFVDGNTVEVKE